jgi:hypothetical protein
MEEVMAILEKKILDALLEEQSTSARLSSLSTVLFTICVAFGMDKDDTFALMGRQWDNIEKEFNRFVGKRHETEV